MINNSKIVYRIAHLFYQPANKDIVEKHRNAQAKETLSFINFSCEAERSWLTVNMFRNKTHAEMFQLFFNFIQKGEEKPQGIAYECIQETLRKKILSTLKKQSIKIKINKCQVMSSEQLQVCEFKGIFVHRKYNLDSASYNIVTKRNNLIWVEMKKCQRSDSVRLYQKAIRCYIEDKMEDVYNNKYQNFIDQKSILRYLYKVNAKLQVDVVKEGGETIHLGLEPTEHLMQIESFFNPISSMEQFFLTDFDFTLRGNYFLKDRKHSYIL